MTYVFLVKAIIHCATMLANNNWNERNYKIIHDFVFFFNMQ